MTASPFSFSSLQK
ncbi:hypothetical protein ECPA23_2298, partial [Escherichia coli PA23]